LGAADQIREIGRDAGPDDRLDLPEPQSAIALEL